jgi:hypothetical protein
VGRAVIDAFVLYDECTRTPCTLALTDLAVVDDSVRPAMGDLADALLAAATQSAQATFGEGGRERERERGREVEGDRGREGGRNRWRFKSRGRKVES